MSIPKPLNEADRLEALRRYRVLDTDAEAVLDDITDLASFICKVPIAYMAFVDEERQWFKSKKGIAPEETPRGQAFCAYTIMSREIMVVEDACADSRFVDNPMVTGDPHIRFYAGAPLLSPDGHGIGTLCIVDRKPNKLSEDQRGALQSLAKLAMVTLELKRVSSVLVETEAEVRALSGLIPICSYCKSVRDDSGYWKKVEAYLHEHTGTLPSHSICPECMKVHFPGICDDDGEVIPG